MNETSRTEVTWVVVHPAGGAVLVTEAGGLPSSEPAGTIWLGDAPALTAQMAGLGLDAVVLGCLDWSRGSPGLEHLTIAATPRPEAGTEPAAPPGTRWAAPPPGVPAAVAAGRARAGRPPWETTGWFPAAEGWLRERLAAAGRPVTGRVEQYRVWELSCVLRAPTADGTVWLKASAGSPLFADEGALMAVLGEWFPGLVPAPLAVDRPRRLVLLDDLGPELGHDAPLERQEEVMARVARMQAATAGRLDALAAAGLTDRSPARLAEQAAAWLPDLDAAARLPGIDEHAWLTPDESAAVTAALPRLLALCGELADGPLPRTLLHGDLHMENVAAGPDGPVLFDWTDACTGHPFLDLVTAVHGDDATRERLLGAYLDAWAGTAPPGRLAGAWRVAEVLGPLHHAVSYRAIASACVPPVDDHMARTTAEWLRALLRALER
jgi:hypothetical protein